MDIRKVKKLIELLEESGVTEIEVCEGEESVRISRQLGHVGQQTVVQVPEAVAAPVPVANPVAAPATSAPEAVAEADDDGHQIKAPMVGIFYTSPAPGEPAFVQVGQKVKEGDVLCVIEAMKIMNQIEADASGEIARIHADNGEPVEYGQPLFTIR